MAGRILGSKDEILRKFKHSFARQLLDDYGIVIQSQQEPVLPPIPGNQPLYNISIPKPYFLTGEEFVEHQEMKILKYYHDLKNLGFVVESVNLSDSEQDRWSHRQKKKYQLKRISNCLNPLMKIPPEHNPQVDYKNGVIRLVGPKAGPMGVSDWIPIKKGFNKRRGMTVKTMLDDPDAYLKKIYKIIAKDDTEDKKKVYFNELPFMMTNANEIVCFPKTHDMPLIGIVGLRGTGKCIVQDGFDDYIVDGDGRPAKISDRPKTVICYDDKLRPVKAAVNKYYNRKVNEVIRLTTHRGDNISVTPEHPMLTVNGWKQAKDLEIGEYIARTNGYPINGKSLPSWEARLLGVQSASGSFGSIEKRLLIRISGLESEKFRLFIEKKYLKRVNNNLRFSQTGNRKNTIKKVSKSFKGKHYDKWLKKYDLIKQDEKTFGIPTIINHANKKTIKDFLTGFMDSSSNLSINTNNRLIIKCRNEHQAIMIKQLFHRIGLHPSLQKTHGENRKVVFENLEQLILLKKFRFHNEKLKKQFSSLTKKSANGSSKSNIPISFLKKYYPELFGENNPLKKKIRIDWSQFKSQKSVKPRTLKKIVGYLGTCEHPQLVNGSVNWVPIKKKLLKKGTFTVWDIEVDHPSHNFVANEYIVHNSYCLHSLVDRFYWSKHFPYNMAILNDSSSELGSWTKPNSDKEQKTILKKFHEKPLPLPLVFFYPSSKDEYKKDFMGDVGFNITIPWKEIIMNDSDYLDFGRSKKSFSKIRDKLLACENEEEVRMIIEEMEFEAVSGKKGGRTPQNSITKINDEIEMLFETKLTSISHEDQGLWKSNVFPEREYEAYAASAMNKIIPVLGTQYISYKEDLMSIYFRYIAGLLLMNQKQDPYLVKKEAELMLVADELHNLTKRKGAKDMLARIGSEGRPNRVGLIGSSQSIDDFPARVQHNLTYLLCFQNPGDAGKIKNRYKLDKETEEKIANLDKHECLAYTTEHFIVYDADGNRRKSNGSKEVFIGKTLPPYSTHPKPKKKKK